MRGLQEKATMPHLQPTTYRHTCKNGLQILLDKWSSMWGCQPRIHGMLVGKHQSTLQHREEKEHLRPQDNFLFDSCQLKVRNLASRHLIHSQTYAH